MMDPVGVESISVAIPVHNGQNHLREALDSVLKQSRADFEIVISENWSSDETPSLLADYARMDSRIRVHRTDSLLPQVQNLNRAVQLCSGTWVQLLCHDDIMLPDCLETLQRVIARNAGDRVGLIGHGPGALFSNGHVHHPAATGEESVAWNGREFLKRHLRGDAPALLPALTTAMVRRSAFLSMGGFDERFQHCDTFLWMRMLMTWDYVSIDQALTLTRIHGSQDTKTVRRSLRSVDDLGQFWPAFIREARSELGLSFWCSCRAYAKPLGAAGTAIAVELMKRDLPAAWAMVNRLSPSWWPFLPAFVLRSMRRQKAIVRSWKNQVPIDVLYP